MDSLDPLAYPCKEKGGLESREKRLANLKQGRIQTAHFFPPMVLTYCIEYTILFSVGGCTLKARCCAGQLR